MSIISRIINMYMNEKVLINYVKNEHLTEKAFLGDEAGTVE